MVYTSVNDETPENGEPDSYFWGFYGIGQKQVLLSDSFLAVQQTHS
jgi:hypothetical protein